MWITDKATNRVKDMMALLPARHSRGSAAKDAAARARWAEQRLESPRRAPSASQSTSGDNLHSDAPAPEGFRPVYKVERLGD